MLNAKKASRAAAALFAAVALAASPVTAPEAHASKIDDMRAEVEAAQDRYNSCQDELDALDEQASLAEEKIEASETELARLQSELGEQARWEYKNDPVSFFVEAITSSDGINSLFNELEYLHSMSSQKASLVAQTKQAREELSELRTTLDDTRTQAEDATDRAKEIVDSIAPELEAYEAEMRAYYGYHGGGPAEAIPSSGTVVDYARSRIGCPYVWGGSGDEAFDCSGLVMWAYAQVGRSLPHNSEAQYAAADEVVPLSEARPGDVLWRSGHVGICTSYGAKSYVHAPTSGAYVREGDPAGWSGFSCALRFYY